MGDHLLTLLRELKKPCVTTMHTTLALNSSAFDSPRNAELHADVVKEIEKRSSAIVVMTKMAANILENDYGVNADKIRIIQHGSPAIPFVPSQPEKRALGFGRRVLLSTFGLLSRGKGIESAIKALPYIIEDYPELCYLVIGATHPQVRQREGEKYRETLMSLVQRLGLEKNVKFDNRFLTKDELIQYLKATDVYVCPYPNKDQLSSGTVTYAIAAGKAIVSTPFNYAKEVLADGRGILCKFENPESIAKSIRHLLENPEQKARMEKLAYEYGQCMTWSSVASRYVSLFNEVAGVFNEMMGEEADKLCEVNLH
jgi:glycosyltransferase involved in cell wall biosynthesis